MFFILLFFVYLQKSMLERLFGIENYETLNDFNDWVTVF